MKTWDRKLTYVIVEQADHKTLHIWMIQGQMTKPPCSSHTYVKFAALGNLQKSDWTHLRNYSFPFPSSYTTQTKPFPLKPKVFLQLSLRYPFILTYVSTYYDFECNNSCAFWIKDRHGQIRGRNRKNGKKILGI